MGSTISRNLVGLRNPIIVTDLDGTLLDFSDFSFEAAKPSLNLLKAKNIPVIFCSSKTPDEIVYWRRKLRNNAPFVCENGAAVYLPRKSFPNLPKNLKDWRDFAFKILGSERSRLRRVFENVRSETGIDMTGFSDMDILRIKEICGFASVRQARLSAARLYSEPFIFGEHVMESEITGAIQRFAKMGLRVIRGRRLFHLAGNNDKGLAVDYLRGVYQKKLGMRPAVIGLGDSKNDIEMLKAADLSYLVMGKNRRYDEDVVKVVRPHLAGAPGPEGWQRAISSLFSNSTD